MPRTITLVVMGRGSGIASCLRIVYMLREAIKKFARIEIVIAPSHAKAIQVEDAGLVECVDEELALEKLIAMCAKVVKRRIEVACAAGIAKDRGLD